MQPLVVDLETTGLDWRTDKIFGVAVCHAGKAEYWDTREDEGALSRLQDRIDRHDGPIVGHNFKFDAHFLTSAGVRIDFRRVSCTEIRASLINEHEHSFGLDTLAKKYCGFGKMEGIYEKLAELFGGRATKNVQMPNLHRAPKSLAEPYAKDDVLATEALWFWQEAEIERQGIQEVLALETELWPIVFDMERRGIPVDVARAEQAMNELTVLINRAQGDLNRIAGFEVNPNPSNSLKDLFAPKQDKDGTWRAVDGTRLETTGAGNASLDAGALERMTHPASDVVIRIRKLTKCRDVFVKGHVLGHQTNGTLWPNINQTKGDEGGTGTGRLSYSRPALQQIPSRDQEIASICRPLFIPEAGQEWGCWDWEQFEFRMFAHYINNPRINKLFAENPATDFHQMVADLTGLPRGAPKAGGANAKQLNLGMVFCMGGGLLAQQMGLPYSTKTVKFGKREQEILVAGPEALDVVEQYHAMVPGVREIAKKASSIAKSRGYVRTIGGRHIRFPGGEFVHKASGLIYQGSSADCMKRKTIELYNLVKNTDARLLLIVHDEFNFTLPVGDEKLRAEIKDCLETFDGERSPFKLRVPIKSDGGFGANWAKASGKG